MPFVIVLVGLAVLVSAYNDTLSNFGTLLKGDILGSTGKPGFIYWIIAVGVIGGIGYIKPIRPLANTFLVLVILVLFLSNGGFFNQFNAAIKEISLPTGNVTFENLQFSTPSTNQGSPL